MAGIATRDAYILRRIHSSPSLHNCSTTSSWAAPQFSCAHIERHHICRFFSHPSACIKHINQVGCCCLCNTNIAWCRSRCAWLCFATLAAAGRHWRRGGALLLKAKNAAAEQATPRSRRLVVSEGALVACGAVAAPSGVQCRRSLACQGGPPHRGVRSLTHAPDPPGDRAADAAWSAAAVAAAAALSSR